MLTMLFTIATAAAQGAENQFWPKLDAFVKLSGKTRLYLVYSATRLNSLDTYSDGDVGGYLDFYTFPILRLGSMTLDHPDAARKKSLMIRMGYVVDRTLADSSNSSVTHVPTIEAHAHANLPWKILLQDRNRLDFRIINRDYRPRYRNRLKADRTFRHGRLDITPYAHVEVFYDWHYNTFDRFRYTAGMECALTRHIILGGYYARQRDSAPSEKFVNAVGAEVHFYVR